MSFLVYFSIALVFYLVFLFIEVTYLDLLEARVDTNLTYEACVTIAAAMVWPLVVVALLSSAFFGVVYQVTKLLNSPKIGWFHRQLGFVVSKCSQKVFGLLRKLTKKCKEFKNAAALSGAKETSGQNQEGSEAAAGGTV